MSIGRKVYQIEELPSLRRQQGLTQKQVAQRMGTVQPSVARFEKILIEGKETSLTTLRRYVKALDLSLDICLIEQAR